MSRGDGLPREPVLQQNSEFSVVILFMRYVFSECPVHKGYVLYTTHQPPLCLRLDKRLFAPKDAKKVCSREQAHLVRVKTLAVYDIVKDLLISKLQLALELSLKRHCYRPFSSPDIVKR